MKPRTPIYITIPLALSVILFTFYVFSGGNILYVKHPIVLSVLALSLILLLILEALNEIIYNQKLKFFSEQERHSFIEKNRENYFVRLYKSGFYAPTDKSEKVKEIDHDFDGILELDNKLPGWWVNLFYLSIVFALLYFCAYLFTDFADPQKEYKIAYERQLTEVSSYEKTRPQATLERAKFNEELVSEGKALFEEICATCHNLDGSGSTGPNLTDEYWINKQEKELFKNVFYMVWNGSKNNPTMRAFGATGEVKGNDIEKLSSYVYAINKDPKKPANPKAPQGEKITWEEPK
ncbi:MAG: cbb3-type cytochrome c oxidase N-terminal domain-containing protein [Flavobacteriales bacterium AspAUS03]